MSDTPDTDAPALADATPIDQQAPAQPNVPVDAAKPLTVLPADSPIAAPSTEPSEASQAAADDAQQVDVTEDAEDPELVAARSALTAPAHEIGYSVMCNRDHVAGVLFPVGVDAIGRVWRIAEAEGDDVVLTLAGRLQI